MHNQQKISPEYIRGLIEGEGCFTFCKAWNKEFIPTFCISMHFRDQMLLVKVADFFDIKTEVYTLKPRNSDGINRGMQSRIMVRDLETLRDRIAPFFYKKLIGNKGIQFDEWIERIGKDPLVPKRYKVIYERAKNGFWDKQENSPYKKP